jgi:DNA-binding response OmpR family regulator
MYKIYIVEDDEKIKNELSTLLEKYGYKCETIKNFDNVVEDVLNSNAHLVLLDLNLPLFDGYYVCKQIRKTSNVPIIVVTSKDSETDELMSMNLGADDFVTKPYNTQILLSRIASLLKRAYNTESSNVLSYNNLRLDVSKSIAKNEESTEEVELTKNELKILYILVKNPGQIISREKIMEELWQSEEFVDDNTLTVNINRLRKKLEDIGLENMLTTKRGQGYML